ncbi:MAG: undecaprenyl-diphosphate phosphatase [Brachymonas sp.]|nr:undecaprenyl-diphosphate phosphatase [Brachymonas sp.]
MDMLLLLKAALMGVVEGLTEFLPISSTGHLILTGALINFAAPPFSKEKADAFDIAIQTGAIFAVILVYWQKIRSTVVTLPNSRDSQKLALNIFIAFLPAVILGLLFGKAIKAHLFTPQVVATTFILGAFVILWAERRQTTARITSVEAMTPWDALKVGLVQCTAMIPGTSRSGATIIGGMLCGLERKVATEFSFFLAIPTLIGAGVYSLYKVRDMLTWDVVPVFLVGLVLAFISAWLCVRWLLRFISNNDFIPFAWYRIAFGLIVLATWWWGWVDWHQS